MLPMVPWHFRMGGVAGRDRGSAGHPVLDVGGTRRLAYRHEADRCCHRRCLMCSVKRVGSVFARECWHRWWHSCATVRGHHMRALVDVII